MESLAPVGKEEAEPKEALALNMGDSLTEDGNPKEILTLNVSGTLIPVPRFVLTQVEGSLLQAQFSGRWNNVDENGNLMVHVSTELFKPLLEVLYLKATLPEWNPETMSVSVEDFGGSVNRFQRFLGLVEYYGLTPALYPVRLHFNKDRATTATSIYYEGMTIGDPSTQMSYSISPDDPDLFVSFVELVALRPDSTSNGGVLSFDWSKTGRMDALSNGGRRCPKNTGKRWVIDCGRRRTTLTTTNMDDTESVDSFPGCSDWSGRRGQPWLKLTLRGAFTISNVKLMSVRNVPLDRS